MVTAALATGDPDDVVTLPERLPLVARAQMAGTQATKRYKRSFVTLLTMKFGSKNL
jgi:hypothetical protein